MKMKKLLYWLIVLPLLASILLPATPVRAQSTEILRPSDNGTFTNWTAVGATNNWECVDEVPSDNDTTYVYIAANDVRDSYNLQAHTTETGTITNVRVYVRALCALAGKTIRLAVVIGGTAYEAAAAKALTTSYADYYDDWAQNPETPDAWTWDAIDALEVSFMSVKLAGKEARVTTVWLEVTYTIPADISNTPDNYAFGLLAEGATANTTLTCFTVTNNGSSNVTITIGGTDMIGDFPWTLDNDGNPGVGRYGLWAGLAETSYNITVRRDLTYNTLVSNLAASANQSWGLKIWAPTIFTGGGQVSGNVTLTVTLP